MFGVPGPYVQIATVCEKVLQERDNVLSVIRAIDRLIITTNSAGAPDELPEGNKIRLTLLVTLKSDDARGRYPVTIRVQDPAARSPEPKTVDVNFEGEERGVNLILQLEIEVVEGLHWFDVLVSDRLLTRVPLKIIYQRMPSGA